MDWPELLQLAALLLASAPLANMIGSRCCCGCRCVGPLYPSGSWIDEFSDDRTYVPADFDIKSGLCLSGLHGINTVWTVSDGTMKTTTIGTANQTWYRCHAPVPVTGLKVTLSAKLGIRVSGGVFQNTDLIISRQPGNAVPQVVYDVFFSGSFRALTATNTSGTSSTDFVAHGYSAGLNTYDISIVIEESGSGDGLFDITGYIDGTPDLSLSGIDLGDDTTSNGLFNGLSGFQGKWWFGVVNTGTNTGATIDDLKLEIDS